VSSQVSAQDKSGAEPPRSKTLREGQAENCWLAPESKAILK